MFFFFVRNKHDQNIFGNLLIFSEIEEVRNIFLHPHVRRLILAKVCLFEHNSLDGL